MGDIATPLTSLNCKIEQGVDTLKSFIYLTNEYGVPSVSYIDDFISNFGHDIVTGQFRYSNMDGFWDTVKKDCEKNKVQYKEVYGSLFYELVPKYLQVVTKGWSEEEKKDLISSEKDKLDLLKDFISNFDKYISEGLDMQEVYLENTPELIKKDENGEEYIDIHLYWHYYNSYARMYRNKITLLKGSHVHELSPRVSTEVWGQKMLHNRVKQTDGDVTTMDIVFASPSGASNYVCGRETNGWEWWKNENGSIIASYRTRVTPVTPQKPVVNTVETVQVNKNLLVDSNIVKNRANTEAKYATSEIGVASKVYIENTPDLIKVDEDGNKYIQLHCFKRGRTSHARLYSTGYMMLLKGSEVSSPPIGVDNMNQTVELERIYRDYTTNGELKTNILFRSSRIATSLVVGTFDNVWNHWVNDNNKLVRVYKDPIQSTMSAYKTPASAKIPKYRLKAQYSSNGSQSLLGRELRLDGKFFGLIIGDTQAKIDGKAYDLSIYIYKNKIDISRLSIFVAPFLAAYELAED